jgi:TRAP-type C4-dicarboxylate transport system substrate-binding protein
VVLLSKDVWGDLDDAEKKALTEAAKAGAKASRVYAAEAQKSGVDSLRKDGMQVVGQIDRAKFADVLKAVRPEYEKKFGAAVISQIESIR